MMRRHRHPPLRRAPLLHRRLVASGGLAALTIAAVVAVAAPALAETTTTPTTGPTTTEPTDPSSTTTTTTAPQVTSPPVTEPSGLPTIAPPLDPGAPAPPPEPPIPDPSPQVNVVIAQLHVLDVQKWADNARAALDAAVADEVAATTRRDMSGVLRDQMRGVLAGAAADAYIRGGLSDPVALTNPTAETYIPAVSAQVLASTAIGKDVRELKNAIAKFEAEQSALALISARRDQAQTAVDAIQGQMDEATANLTKARRPVRNGADVSPSVMGDSVMTPEEIAGWFTDRGIVGYVAGTDILQLSQWYVDEGKSEHIRGDVAFAQAIVETGAFTSPLTTHNNYAGIGACDTCATGWDFASPQLGVRAQAQLLHSYADKTLSTSDLANDPVGANPDHLTVRGCCDTWNRLTGTWATDPNYGPKIMTVYLSMLQWALHFRQNPPPAAASTP